MSHLAATKVARERVRKRREDILMKNGLLSVLVLISFQRTTPFIGTVATLRMYIDKNLIIASLN
jgi:hypothetical protein